MNGTISRDTEEDRRKGVTPFRRLALSVVGAAAMALLWVPAAPASSVSEQSGGFLGVEGGPGESNQIVISQAGNVVTITDSAGIGSVSGCTPNTGSQVTCPLPNLLVVTAGDGDDNVSLDIQSPLIGAASGGGGNDTIDASRSRISLGLAGFAGNDTVIAGAGNDKLDYPDGPLLPAAGPPALQADPPDAGDDHLVGGAGDDLIIGGRGADVLDGGEGNDSFAPTWIVDYSGAGPASGPPPDDAAIDSVTCGPSGGPTSAYGAPPGNDFASVGPGDQVAADCEIVNQTVTCPPGANCIAIPMVTASGSGAASASSLAFASRKRKGKQTVLGHGRRTFVAAGGSVPVSVALSPKQVRKVLGKRSRITATLQLGVRRIRKGKVIGRTHRRVRFTLAR